MLRQMLSAMVLLCLLSAPVQAAEPIESISAKRPAEILIVLMNAGYDVELSKSGSGKPLIIAKLEEYRLWIHFYGCEETTLDQCTSLHLSVGFDRNEPWTADEAIQITRDYRYVSIMLDEEGDPFISWDIITEDGIPRSVFLSAIRTFESMVWTVEEIVFADDVPREAASSE